MCAYDSIPILTNYAGSFSARDQIAPEKFWSRYPFPVLHVHLCPVLQWLVLIYTSLAEDQRIMLGPALWSWTVVFTHAREAPSMRVARVFPSACVVDEKIYVAGGCEDLTLIL
ncbi:hypothetical protein Bca52824_092657 [Brassica carinata]|uniref:Uncharacterized protein n=1 Tax=Brassica carinata TaxID=52824 RepID=A0A8X7NQA3_BRACI|nr:hypothetical protein Bca52824_092657 [Brassica carinata]